MDSSDSNLHRLDGRVAVVTGAAKGLGASTAKVLAALGASVVLLDIDYEAAEQVAEEIDPAGQRALAIKCDVSIEQAVVDAAGIVAKSHGRCDILVNNAGVVAFCPLEDLPVEEWDQTMAVNLRGYFLCMKHFGKMMLERGAGAIVNVASIGGTNPEVGAGAYGASKAANIILARQMAVEWGPRGIRVNALSPGMLTTPMSDRWHRHPEALEQRARMVPLRRIGHSDEAARVIAFLVSDAASYINGQNLAVDGGVSQILIRLLPHPGVDFLENL